jgi:hypothetical protein
LTQEEVFKTEDSINIWWRSSRPFLGCDANLLYSLFPKLIDSALSRYATFVSTQNWID